MTAGAKNSLRKRPRTIRNPRLQIISMGQFSVRIRLKEDSGKYIDISSSSVKSLELLIKRTTRLLPRRRSKVMRSWLSKLQVTYDGHLLLTEKALQFLLSAKPV